MLLFIPAFAAHYVYPIQKLLRMFVDSPNRDKPQSDDRSWAVWIVFSFLVWMADSNFDNNVAKWNLCGELGRYVGQFQLPEVCVEKEFADD